MISFVQHHPWYTALILWGLLCVAILVLGWVRANQRDKDGYVRPEDRESIKRVHERIFHSGGVIQPGTPAPRLFNLPGEYMVPKDHPLARVPMHSRFVPVDEAPVRSDIMADQILADQAKAEEQPGKETDAPAPGEPGYEAPHRVLSVTVGQFTVHMMRDSRPALAEARPNGADWPLVEIPEEWAEPLIAFAMEVTRLREGWTVA